MKAEQYETLKHTFEDWIREKRWWEIKDTDKMNLMAFASGYCPNVHVGEIMDLIHEVIKDKKLTLNKN